MNLRFVTVQTDRSVDALLHGRRPVVEVCIIWDLVQCDNLLLASSLQLHISCLL
jgi:hypothetical protein